MHLDVGSGEDPVANFFLEFHPRKDDISEHFYTLLTSLNLYSVTETPLQCPRTSSVHISYYRHNKISSMCSTVTLTQRIPKIIQRHWVVPPSLTNFSSDLDESHNRSLGQVGGRVPPVPPVATPLVADIPRDAFRQIQRPGRPPKTRTPSPYVLPRGIWLFHV